MPTTWLRMNYARRLVLAIAAALGLLLAPGLGSNQHGPGRYPLIANADAASIRWSGPACRPPASITGSAAETAWRLWVAAACPVNPTQYPYVVWENWLEQNQMYPANPSQGLIVPNAGAITTPHLLHGSPLGFLNGLPSDPSTGCTVTANPN
ncbi:MAG: hypothetical protein ACRETL_13650, partial [Gammaproteobacteria bacterium]